MPSSISLPGGQNIGAVDALTFALIQSTVVAHATKSFDTKLREQVNPTEYLSQTLLSTFTNKLASNALFTLTTNETADASFVLEVTKAGLGEPIAWPFPNWNTMPPEVSVVVTLIANPPFDVNVNLANGQYGIKPADPTLHKILYQKTVRIRGKDGLPYHKQNEYLTKDVFEKAFGQAIRIAVDRIAADW